METNKAQAIIEGLLFAAGDPVSLDKIANIIDMDKRKTQKIITDMIDRYDYEHRGIGIIRLEDGYQMCTRGEYFEYISMLAEPRRAQSMSNAAMEVLSVIAYKQPVTKGEIEDIRGVSCDSIVNKLVERGLVEEVGRLDSPGRPMIFGTTEEFLRCFGLGSLTELPDYDIIKENGQDKLYSQQVMEGLDNL